MNTVRRLTNGLLRTIAGLTVIAVVTGPVVAVAIIAGNPIDGDLVTSLGDRHVGNDHMIKLLSVAFYLLWAWFCVPAIRQAAISVSTPRHRPGRTSRPAGRGPTRTIVMPADDPGPRAWLARLARFAVGTAAVTATITTSGFVPAVTAAPPAAVATLDDPAPNDRVAADPSSTGTVDRSNAVSHVTAGRRDTPYSIARQHFPHDIDHARDEIIALNIGRTLDTGAAWAGGTFPEGMNVITPLIDTEDPAAPTDPPTSGDVDDTTEPPTTAGTYIVQPGDGWIDVVEALWGPDAAGEWQHHRAQLVGQTVAPGVELKPDTKIIHPGWTFTHPDHATTKTAGPAQAATGPILVDIQPGDTLYRLIDTVIAGPVTAGHIDAVARHNHGMADSDGTHIFDSANPNLIHPGQTVDLRPAVDYATATPDQLDRQPVVDEPDPAPDEPNTPVVNDADIDDVSVDDVRIVDEPDAPAAAPAADDEADVPVPGSVADDEADVPLPAPVPVDISDADLPAATLDAPTAPSLTPPAVSPHTVPAPPVPIVANPNSHAASQPGDVAATPPVTAPVATPTDSNESPSHAQLAAGGIAVAGLLIALDRLRRRARTRRPRGTTVAAPDPAAAHDEHAIRDAAHLDRAHRVNLAVRHLGAHLADRDAPLRPAYLLADDATVTAAFDRPVELGAGWIEAATVDNAWTCDVDDATLATYADQFTPWPALVPIGTLDDGTDVVIDLEGLGTVAITGPDAVVDRVVAALITALSASPFADLITCIDDNSVALGGLDTHVRDRLSVNSVDELIDRLATWIAPFDFDDQHLIAARHRLGGEYEPCVAAVIAELTGDQRHRMRQLPLGGSHPIAVVTTDPSIASTTLDVDDEGNTTVGGRRVRCHRLEPVAATRIAELFDQAQTADVVDTAPLEVLDELTDSIRRATHTPHLVDPASAAEPDRTSAVSILDTMLPPVPGQLFDTEPDADWTIRVLGPLEIVHRDGSTLNGPKVRELATLLATHPAGLSTADLADRLDRPESALTTRLSELRKLLGHGDTVAGRRYLPANKTPRGYHLEAVAVDSVRLARCLDEARRATGLDKLNWLVGALELVRGQIGLSPYTSWGWAGHLMTTLEATITDAGLELAELAGHHEQWRVVDWAGSQVRLANPYEQRVVPHQIEARQRLGDQVGIRRLHDEALDAVDTFEPDVEQAFHTAFDRLAQ